MLTSNGFRIVPPCHLPMPATFNVLFEGRKEENRFALQHAAQLEHPVAVLLNQLAECH